MGYTLLEFLKNHGLNKKSLDIDESVSPFPRTIQLPECPKCGNNLFLSHPNYKPDPFIENKRQEGIYGAKYPKNRKWLVGCWTGNCNFSIPLTKNDLVQCPECKRHFMEDYSLYDHMRYQCTRSARSPEMLKKAGVERYLGGLMVIDSD
jgi:ribosomal protein S27AE